MSYAIEYKVGLDRDTAGLPRSVLERIDRKILALAENPRPSGAIKLAGGSNFYRLRIGDYRVIYTIDDRRQAVTIMLIAHRRESYRGL